MEASSLGQVFTRHLGFPRQQGARLASESFADRISDRVHSLAEDGGHDAEAWVEHFFALEHPFEAREKEFRATSRLLDRGPTVLEFELADQEYVVIENDDDLVVVSNAGSIVLDRTRDLTQQLKAAVLPSAQQVRPTAVAKPAGERAYYVDRKGGVVNIDAKAVAQALRGAELRVEPLARVSHAPTRLAAFAPSSRYAEPELRPKPVQQVAKLAAAERRGTSSEKVVILERKEVREIEGPAARVWRDIAEKLAARGQPHAAEPADGVKRLGGASGVALSRQTYAVKVGGVVALVQRPQSEIAARARNAERTVEVARQGRMTLSGSEHADNPVRSGFWLSPRAAAVGTGAVATSAGGFAAALTGAGPLRARASREIARQVTAGRQPEAEIVGGVPGDEAELPLAALGVRAPRTAPVAGQPGVSASALRALAPRGVVDERSFVAPTYTIYDTGETSFAGPLAARDVLPATTLRVLYDALERTASYEGFRLPSLEVAVNPFTIRDGRPAPKLAFQERDISVVRTLTAESSPVAAPRERVKRALSLPFVEAGVVVDGELAGALERAFVREMLPRRPEPSLDEVVSGPAGAPAGRAMGRLAAGPGLSRGAAHALAGAESAPRSVGRRAPAFSWIDWALEHQDEARTKSRGTGAVALRAPRFARAGLAVPASAAEAPVHVVAGMPSAGPERGLERRASPESAARFRSLFIEFEPVIGGSSAAAGGPAAAGEAVPEVGFVRMPMALDAPTLESLVGNLGRETPGHERGTRTLPGQFTPTETRRGGMAVQLRPMLLDDVNSRRLPAASAPVEAYTDASSGAEEFVVPVPLWVQMADTAPVRTAAEEPSSSQGTRSSSRSAAPVTAGFGAPRGEAVATRIEVDRTIAPEGTFAAPQGGARSESVRVPRLGAEPLRAPAADLVAGPPTAEITRSVPRAADFARESEALGRSRGGDLLRTPGASASRLVEADASELPTVRPLSLSPGRAGRPAALGELSPEMTSVVSPAPAMSEVSQARSTVSRAEAGLPARAAGRSAPAAAAPAAPAAPQRSSAGQAADRRAVPAAGQATAVAASGLASRAAPRARAAEVADRELRVAPQRRGRGYLRFKWPALSRWWQHEARSERHQGGAFVARHGDQDSPSFVADSSAAAGAPARGQAGSSAYVAARAGARSAGSEGSAGTMAGATGEALGSAGSSVTTLQAGAPAWETVGAGEPVYVAVSDGGQASVVTPRTAGRVKRPGAGATSLDMTVVAAITPQAPSLDDMASAGSRPYLKGKKDAPAKGAAQKTDSLSLQGTVDSLAQRIYHRLKRRLQSDRERFGG